MYINFMQIKVILIIIIMVVMMIQYLSIFVLVNVYIIVYDLRNVIG
jgi:hypothetical protein